MIDRISNKKSFILTQSHNIEYYLQSYSKKNTCIKDLNKSNITETKLKKANIRNNLFKWYFSENLNNSEEECIIFFKDKLKEIFVINDDIILEIKKCKKSVNYNSKLHKL